MTGDRCPAASTTGVEGSDRDPTPPGTGWEGCALRLLGRGPRYSLDGRRDSPVNEMSTTPKDRFQLLCELFDELDALDRDRRARRLAEIARDHPEVHEELLGMLAAPTPVLSDMERIAQPLLENRPGDDGEGTESELPRRIGPFEIVRLLGRGGMGEVLEGRQLEPIERRVAIKRMRPGLDSRAVVARFEAERQALARLEHPSIARMLDAGTGGDGRPWFAMEYVDGPSITDWLRRQDCEPTLEERIELFLPVCDALQHAHRKGLIHRDLKPSNILVASGEDGRATPKVIDFGIAKAIDRPLLAQTLATRLGEIVGTPEYMSPEQATLGAVDVDTRSDVYGLGLVLYELLVGELPLPPERLRDLPFDEMCRRIREDPTPRPSTRLSARSARTAAPGAPSRQAAETHDWPRHVRRDLDAILLKALETDRDRRYDSAGELAGDLRRFLAGDPVTAAPPSAAYQASKFVRRHRLPVALAAAAVLSLVVGTIASTLGFVSASRAAREARTAQSTAEATADFLIGLFRGADVRQTAEPDLTVRELLERGTGELEEGLREDPLLRGAVLDAVGQVHSSLGEHDRAADLLSEALELRQGAGADPLQRAETMTKLGHVRVWQRTPQSYDQARQLLDDALELQRTHGAEEEAIAHTLYERGWLAYREERYDEAADFTGRALELFRSLDRPLDEARALTDLGQIAGGRADLEQAKRHFDRALSLMVSEVGPDHLEVASTKGIYATTLELAGELEPAETLRREALAIQRQLLGPDANAVGATLSNLAWNLNNQRRHSESEEALEEALRIKRANLGPDHLTVAFSLNGMVVLRATRGDFEGAEEAQREALRILAAEQGPYSTNTLWGVGNLASVVRRSGRPAEAEEIARDGLQSAVENGAPERVHHKLSGEIGAALSAQRRYEEAEPILVAALEGLTALYGATSPYATEMREHLDELMLRTGRPPLPAAGVEED